MHLLSSYFFPDHLTKHSLDESDDLRNTSKTQLQPYRKTNCLTYFWAIVVTTYIHKLSHLWSLGHVHVMHVQVIFFENRSIIQSTIKFYLFIYFGGCIESLVHDLIPCWHSMQIFNQIKSWFHGIYFVDRVSHPKPWEGHM